MRACPVSITRQNAKTLRYPVWVTDKEDGIRCRLYAREGKVTAFSRTHKPIPNLAIQDWAEREGIPGFDGEIILPGAQFNDIQSFCMSEYMPPPKVGFMYRVFDWTLESAKPYLQRLQKLNNMIQAYGPERTELIPVKMIKSAKDLCIWFNRRVKAGKEGLIVRDGYGPYKHGQATWNEGYMYKFKKWSDAEATIIGFVEAQANQNLAEQDHFGLTKRSSHKANKFGKGTLGALVCLTDDSIEFEIGSGWTADMAQWIWDHREELRGERVTYKYHDHGIKEKPRGAIFKAIRLD